MQLRIFFICSGSIMFAFGMKRDPYLQAQKTDIILGSRAIGHCKDKAIFSLTIRQILGYE